MPLRFLRVVVRCGLRPWCGRSRRWWLWLSWEQDRVRVLDLLKTGDPERLLAAQTHFSSAILSEPIGVCGRVMRVGVEFPRDTGGGLMVVTCFLVGVFAWFTDCSKASASAGTSFRYFCMFLVTAS